MSPLLIGFAPVPSPLPAGLRRAERGVRRLDPLESESGEGRAAALSTVSSERDEDDEDDRLVRADPERSPDPDSLREEDLDELRLEEPLELELDPLDEPEPLDELFERRPDERFSSPVGCSRRRSLELEPEPDLEELREERFGGATSAVSQ